MDDLAEKITGLLNDPQTMQKIQNLSNILSNKNPVEDNSKKNKSENFSANTSNVNTSEIFNTLLNLNNSDKNITSDSQNIKNGFASPEILGMLTKILPVISNMNKEDKHSIFFSSLRPLLSQKRQLKLDKAIKILKVIKIFSAIKEQEIF